jgi:hypothetical protein
VWLTVGRSVGYALPEHRAGAFTVTLVGRSIRVSVTISHSPVSTTSNFLPSLPNFRVRSRNFGVSATGLVGELIRSIRKVIGEWVTLEWLNGD